MLSKRFTIIASTIAAAAVAAPVASAAPTVTEAAGPNAAAIQGAVDTFRNSLGTDNGVAPPAQASGRREINWDGVPDDRAAPSFMPEGQFRGRGALFSTPGLGVQISGDDNNDNGAPDADPDLVEFANLNANYPNVFGTFSPERLFSPVGSNITNTRFVVAGTDTPAQTNGFGVVFTDVDVAGSTTIELLDAQGTSLGVFPAPASPGNESLSFLGITLDPGVAAATAKITTGSAALVPPPGPSPDDGAADIVAMDDFIYGEPQPSAAGQPDTKGPELTVKGVSKKVEKKELAKGLKLKLTTDEPATLDARLSAKARTVDFDRAGAKVILAEKSLGLGSGQRQLKLKAKRNVLKGASSLKAEVRIVATDASGNRTTVTKKVSVR